MAWFANEWHWTSSIAKLLDRRDSSDQKLPRTPYRVITLVISYEMNAAYSHPTPYPIPLFQLMEKSCWRSQIVVLGPVLRYDHASRAEGRYVRCAHGELDSNSGWKGSALFRIAIIRVPVSHSLCEVWEFPSALRHYSIQGVTCRCAPRCDGRTDVEAQDPGKPSATHSETGRLPKSGKYPL